MNSKIWQFENAEATTSLRCIFAMLLTWRESNRNISNLKFQIQIMLYDDIEEVLTTVYDPEIPVNIVALGLVYELEVDEHTGKVKIIMTLTAPGCPVGGEIVEEVQDKVRAVEGVNDVYVHLTFDPPWDRDMMSEEAKLELGFL